VKDFLGVAFLFGGYVGSALLLAWLSDMPLERALTFITLFAISQVRWFSRDESPLDEPLRPKRSFMSRVRDD
jgi:hypothetical protein